MLPYGEVALETLTSVATMAQNTGYMGMFHLNQPVTFTKGGIDITIADAATGTNVYIGIYSLSGTLLVTIKIPITANATGFMGATIASFTLEPGSYFLLWASDSASGTARLAGALLTTTYQTNILNGNQVRFGFKASQLSGGALLGSTTFSTFTKNPNAMPLVLLEP